MDTAILLKELENLVREEEDAEERARWEAIMRIIQIAITRAEMSKAGGPDDLLPPREIPGLQEGRSLRQTVLRDREGEGSSPKR